MVQTQTQSDSVLPIDPIQDTLIYSASLPSHHGDRDSIRVSIRDNAESIFTLKSDTDNEIPALLPKTYKDHKFASRVVSIDQIQTICCAVA